MNEWKDRPIGNILDETARIFPEKEAIVFENQRITYSELKNKVDALAKGLLELGIEKGDKIALWMGNRPEWLYSKFAISKIGGIMVAINTWYRLYELEYIFKQSDTTAVIMGDNFLNNDFIGMLSELCPEFGKGQPGKINSKKFPLLKNIICLSDKKYKQAFDFKEIIALGKGIPADRLNKIQNSVNADDVVNILYTSGTTAFPKGVQLSHTNIARNGFNIGNRLNFTENDKLWLAIPLFFSFACVNATMAAITHGGSLILQASFDPKEALQLIEKERCTVYYGMTNMNLMILDHPDLKKYNTKSLRTGMTIGAAEIFSRVIDELGPDEINNGYGLTETAAVSTVTFCKDPLEIRLHKVGRPLPGVEIKIVNPDTDQTLPAGKQGEICIRGYNVTQGYYKKPEETAKAIDSNGWFHSGDLGIIDREGYLSFRGRIKEMLKSGGINISTLEVENFLHRHPKIKEAYVVRLPDRVKDEVGLACIELKKGETCAEEEIIDFCKGNIAGFKIPKYVLFVKDFPRTATGKVQKFKLEEIGKNKFGDHIHGRLL